MLKKTGLLVLAIPLLALTVVVAVAIWIHRILVTPRLGGCSTCGSPNHTREDHGFTEAGWPS